MNIAILITTRNRKFQLDRLLKSIAKQSKQASQIVVSSSGQSVHDVVESYSSTIPITLTHTELYGQIRQKRLGIEELSSSNDWVLFLDDDVELRDYTLANLEKSIERELDKNNSLVGVGLKVPSTSHLVALTKTASLFSRMLFLDSTEPGTVLKSGHPVSYLNVCHSISTQWLNGISAWRYDVCRYYGSDFLDSKYSAFEDVFFSYKQGKRGSLVYCPEIEIDFQESSKTDLANVKIFEAASYWRLKFVLENEGFSMIKYLISQIGRNGFFLFYKLDSFPEFLNRLKIISLTTSEIIFQLLFKNDANWSLTRHCKN
jgi:glycosyltransferase involved in cell wall biosynthesis